MNEPTPAAEVSGSARVNDLTLRVGTVNGSGSQTANNTLLRALFQMGLPVSGKNLFPSNIAGLPTWFSIRVNHRGYIAPSRDVNVLVCMNPATAKEDVASVPPGSLVVYEETLRCERYRDDVVFVGVPFQQLVKDVCEPVALRKLVVNMIYVGVVTELIGIDLQEVKRALDKAFARKPKALGLNRDAVRAGLDWVKQHVEVASPFRVERMPREDDMILVDGNSATAVGCVFAGLTVLTWYPITPSSSVAETIAELGETYRRDPQTGETTLAIVQAEDELAAVGMVIGAAWAGARSMTTTSGPGISLMSEFVGLGYFAEVPTVIVDVQRTGPSTGLPTRTQQGDILPAANLSHGDGRHPCLYPANPHEAYEDALAAFDLAEGLQTPVFVLSDLDLGMNLWMSKPFEYPEQPIHRGKVLDAEALAKMEDWGRYKDVDGDGIPYRTLPGGDKGAGAYFTRGSGHDPYARYTEKGDVYVATMQRLARKLETAKTRVPAPVVDGSERAVGILAFGTTHHAVVEARDHLREELGLETDYLRLRAFPFADSVREWIEAHERVYVVEQNHDAQMRRMLTMEFPSIGEKLHSVLHYDGIPVDARSVWEPIAQQAELPVKGGV
jgi:2-oxoglutarate ferredoxin oxidoreductase subunit alpha